MSALRVSLVLALVAMTNPEPVLAQAPTCKEPKEKDGCSGITLPRSGWVLLPGVFYSPDNGLSASAAFLRYFRLAKKEVRPSSIKITGAASFRGNYSLDMDPNFWFPKNRYNLAITSKLSEFERTYFGIGNDSVEADREYYRASRFDFRTEFARALPYGFFLAAIFDLRWQNILETEMGGALQQGSVIGASGGLLSAAGVELRYDTRDSVFYPTRGANIEASPRWYLPALGSDYQTFRFFVDAATYIPLGGRHVLAFDARFDGRKGDSPFDFLSVAGGNRLLRGMLEGRYRDNHYLASQVEYRFPIYWRFGAVAFMGLGRVAHRLSEFDLQGWKYSAGTGLRFAAKRKEGINIRLDVGYADGDTGVYLNVLEAF